MTEEHSPWASPETVAIVTGDSSSSLASASDPTQVTPEDQPGGSPAQEAAVPGTRRPSDQGQRPGPGAGVVTRLRAGGSAKAPAGAPSGSAEAGGSGAVVEFASRDRTVMRWFVGVAATIVVLGLVVVGALFMTGQRG
ncbi:MAG: hypothetical protein JXA67_10470, partial [Micromonosporaceae bacterium]|nr:hypothetical protein [Micromonosporaceae bacterium]